MVAPRPRIRNPRRGWAKVGDRLDASAADEAPEKTTSSDVYKKSENVDDSWDVETIPSQVAAQSSSALRGRPAEATMARKQKETREGHASGYFSPN